MECRPNCSRNPILLLYGEIVLVSFLLLTALAISTKDADIAYGYILFHFDDISPSDPELIEALSSIWGVLCGKEKTLLDESRIDAISVQCSELLVVQHANRQYPHHNVSVSSNYPSNLTVHKIFATRWTDRRGRSQNPFSRARKKKSSWEETSSSVSPPARTTVPAFSSLFHSSIRPSSSPQHHHLTRPHGSSLPIPPQFRAWKQRSAISRRYLLRFLHLATLRHDVSRISFIRFLMQHPRLRIVSYNAWNTMPASWFISGNPRFDWFYKRMQLMAANIRAADPDIIVLQEIRYDETLGDERRRFQLRHLTELLPDYQYIFQVVLDRVFEG